MFAYRLAASATVLVLLSAVAFAQDRRQNEAGKFDFYVLALSWSPSYCEAASERGGDRTAREQCGARPFSFVVHGLWPQYERGFPEYCQRQAPYLENALINSMLDLMPARALVIHEWRKHGTCAGIAPKAYFESVRRARAAVKIPEQFLDLKTPKMVTPDEVEAAFVAANPGLSRKGLAVSCDTRRLHEVRVCMNKDFSFRDCAEVDRRACRRDKLVMPPVRGG